LPARAEATGELLRTAACVDPYCDAKRCPMPVHLRSNPAAPRAVAGQRCKLSTDTSSGLPELPSVDGDALARLERFGGGKLLREMISLYLEHAPARLAAAEAGIAGGDAAAAENALHSLKSSSAQLGALRLSRICEEGETIARSGKLSDIGDIVRVGRAELVRVQEWLLGARDASSA
jgi:HPt (histidine-containing phosphotransfer) domain-containing protein